MKVTGRCHCGQISFEAGGMPDARAKLIAENIQWVAARETLLNSIGL